jgi:hypothetical protein
MAVIKNLARQLQILSSDMDTLESDSNASKAVTDTFAYDDATGVITSSKHLKVSGKVEATDEILTEADIVGYGTHTI